MRFYRSNRLFQWLVPKALWRIRNSTKIYLTFDDGPTPEITPWVLDLLEEKGIKATFFCVGANVEKYPILYQRILDAGHSVGNHTYSHLSAWEHSFVKTWLPDLKKAEQFIQSKMMRPPYGKLFPWQARKISQMGYQPVMWSFISYDFDASSPWEYALEKMIKLKGGSIIVFHDQPKAIGHLKRMLPSLIEQLGSERFSKLPDYK